MQSELSLRFRAALVGLSALAAPVLGLCAAGPAAAREEAPVVLGYEIYVGGFNVMTATANLVFESDQYSLAVGGETTGLLGWLFPLSFDSHAKGKIAASRAQPESFWVDRTRRGVQRRIELSYDGSGPPQVRRTPENPEDAERVPRERQVGTIDPNSAVISLLAAFRTADGCNGEVTVYDGARRLGVSAEAAGEEILKPNGYSAYAGPAMICRIKLRHEPKNAKEMEMVATWFTEIKAWIAPPTPGAPPVPIKIEAARSLGMAIAHLATVEKRGKPTQAAAAAP
jgi:Protein of unknown function (DUF3108)